jgi:hypothetical protein
MSYVNVRISRRVLWIGGDAYPLQNVARAATVRGRLSVIAFGPQGWDAWLCCSNSC